MFCCSISVSSISADNAFHFEKLSMASSMPTLKRYCKIDDNKMTDDKEVNSDVLIGSLLQSRKNSPKSLRTKKKSPVVLTQDTLKPSPKPFWLTKGVASLPPKKLWKANNSDISNNDDTDEYKTTSDKADAASTQNESASKAKSTQSYVLPWYFANKFLTQETVEKSGRPSGEWMCLLCHKTLSAKTLSTTSIRHLKLLHNLTEALVSIATDGKNDNSLDMKPEKRHSMLSAI